MKKFLLTFLIVFGFAVCAQAYPDQPITMIVPYNAGGSLDSTTRIITEFMKQELDKPIMINNRPGASGTIGLDAFLKTKADGYTVLVFPTSSFVTPVFQGREAIDTNQFKPVGGFLKSERILFARPDAPYKTFDELISYARENPGKLKFGSGGSTDTAYVFKYIIKEEKLDVNVTLFNGGAPAAAAIMGGHVDLVEGGNGSPADVAAMAGKLVPLCILSDGNLAKYPELKTPLQMGYEYASSVMFGFFLHADAPDEAQQTLSNVLKKVLEKKELQEKFASRGVEPKYFSGAELIKSAEAGAKVAQLYELLGE
ncbi:MAG TPA: tripartite tricarboxylate transporter substrate binding protein [Desulfobacteraceae bacterium]|nr:tripartite tricarboxylate transporter substrate binding protein [Desulfobacteraceae bacterium]